MLASLVSLYSLAPGVYMHNIAEMICKLFQYYIEQKYDDNLGHIWYHYVVLTSAEWYSIGATRIANIKC